MLRIANIVERDLTGKRTFTGRKAAGLLLGGMILSTAGIAYATTFASQEQDGQTAQKARAEYDKAVQTARKARADDEEAVRAAQMAQQQAQAKGLDPVTRALKAAVRNGSMSETRARLTYHLLTDGLRGASGPKRTGAYLEDVAAKLDAMVESGELSSEDADIKMAELQTQLDIKAEFASRFTEELVAKMETGGLSKTEAYLELAAERLDEIVATGELSAKDAEARLTSLEDRIAYGEKKADYEGKWKAADYLDQVAQKLDAMVQAGELSAEDAEAKMIAIEREIAEKQASASRKENNKPKTAADLEKAAAEFDALVKAGKLSAEEAAAKLTAMKKTAVARAEVGPTDARAVLRAVRRARLSSDQKSEIRVIEREVTGTYRKIPRRDKQRHAELAKQVKVRITKLLDARQVEQFESALERLDRGYRRGVREQTDKPARQRERKPRKP